MGSSRGSSAERGVPAGVPAQKGGSSKVPAEGSSTERGSSKGFEQGFQHLCFTIVPLHFSPDALLAPLVDWAKAARAAVGTRGYAGPIGLGCTDLAAHPDTKVAIPSGTTIARIRLTRPLLAADKPPCALTDWLQGVLEDNPDVPILQVRLHAADVDDVIQACTGRANPTVNKTQQRDVGTEGTTLLFAAHKPTTKKAGKDKYPFKHPHLDTLRYVVDSKPAMALPNYSLTSHSPYRWKPELVGLTTPVLMESEDAVLPLPMCHALPLIGTSEPVKQVDIFREANVELLDPHCPSESPRTPQPCRLDRVAGLGLAMPR